MSDRKRVLIDAPSEMVILAARHLDATEGPVQVGAIVDASTRSAITAVLRYIAEAHNAPAVAGEKGVTRRPCRYCPDPLCPEDCPECGGPIHDLDAVPTRPGRLPRQGEIWHPADDPDDCVSVTGTSSNIVFYQAPPDAGRGRSVPWNNSTNTDDFTRCYIPQDPGHRPTPVDLSTGTRGEYNEWVIETKLGRRLGVCVDRSPYPEDARQVLEALRTAHPGMAFRAVRETTTRTEEDW